LELLSAASGDILEDEKLINTLATSKKTSEEINVKLAEAEKTEKEIDSTRALYRPVAARSGILYFCISDLGFVDPMYQYSLGWFLNLFRMGIQNAPMSPTLEVRLKNLNEYFTYSLFVNICRSLFERNKLLFSLLLCIRIMQSENLIDSAEFQFLLAGATSANVEIKNPCPEWLIESSWIQICGLSRLPNFSGFAVSFADNIPVYRRIFDSATPEEESLAGDWNKKLSRFQKILVLRCLRLDKVTNAVQQLVMDYLGQKFIEPPPFDLGSAFGDSHVKSPLIFVFASGSDPASDLYKFADERGMMRKIDSISLGQGQGPIAEKMINTAMDRGGWVFLQNCHLAVSWMPTLEKIVENIDPLKVHRDFRLWLTSMPSDKFPVSILQEGVKMTVEPPKGLKANLIRSYVGFDDSFLATNNKPNEWRRLLFGLCFLHAIVQDRRRFGPLGWNIAYDFAQGDLQVCVMQLSLFLNDYKEIPFKVLQYLFGEINYGGRVTDDKDRRSLNSILSDYICPQVLHQAYAFSDSGVYKVPQAETQSAFLDYLRSLPINPSPDVFGLHENADITSAQNETLSLFENLMMLQPRAAAGVGGRSRDDVIADVSNDILKRIPDSMPLDEVAAKYPTMYHESMNTVLSQEVLRYSKLLAVISRSLKDVLKALKGLVVMSETLDKLGTSLFNNQVPEMWANVAYPSLKPLASWVVDLEERLMFLKTWIDGGHRKVYWISGFFFPQAFLTGSLQNFARKRVVAIDTVSFDYEV
jgi:dynein heavy chain, axonemal